MAVFTVNNPKSDAITTLSTVDLSADTATSTLTWVDNQVLYLQNGEASASLTVNLKGANVDLINVDGYGSIDTSGGLDITVSNGQTVAVYLVRRKLWLGDPQNTVTVTTTNATTGNSFGWLVE